MTGAVEQAQVVVQLLQPHLVEPLHTLQARWSLYSKEAGMLGLSSALICILEAKVP